MELEEFIIEAQAIGHACTAHGSTGTFVGCRACMIRCLFQVVAALSAATSALRDASSEEAAVLTRAYKKSLLKLHPDKMPHADTWNKLLASQVFDALREAYAKEGF